MIRIRRTPLLVGGAIIAILLGIAFVGQRHYGAFAKQLLISQAQSAGIRMSMGEMKLRLVGLDAENVGLTFREAPIAFNLDKLSLRLSILRLLSLNARIRAEAMAYSGMLESTLSTPLRSDQAELSLLLDKIKVSDHPQVAGFGITDGFLSGTINDLTMTNTGPKSFTAQLSLSDLQKPQGTPLIPSVRDLGLDLSAQLSDDVLQVSDLSLNSSLISGSGSAQIDSVFDKRHAQIKASFDISLTKEGQKSALLAYFIGMSNNRLTPQSKRFELKISGALSKPRLVFADLSGT